MKLISIFGHFLTVSNRHYGRCYVKIIIPLCTFLEFYTHLEANSAKSFQSAFCKGFKYFLKTSYFWWMSSFFSLSSHLNQRSLRLLESCFHMHGPQNDELNFFQSSQRSFAECRIQLLSIIRSNNFISYFFMLAAATSCKEVHDVYK